MTNSSLFPAPMRQAGGWMHSLSPFAQEANRSGSATNFWWHDWEQK